MIGKYILTTFKIDEYKWWCLLDTNKINKIEEEKKKIIDKIDKLRLMVIIIIWFEIGIACIVTLALNSEQSDRNGRRIFLLFHNYSVKNSIIISFIFHTFFEYGFVVLIIPIRVYLPMCIWLLNWKIMTFCRRTDSMCGFPIHYLYMKCT